MMNDDFEMIWDARLVQLVCMQLLPSIFQKKVDPYCCNSGSTSSGCRRVSQNTTSAKSMRHPCTPSSLVEPHAEALRQERLKLRAETRCGTPPPAERRRGAGDGAAGGGLAQLVAPQAQTAVAAEQAGHCGARDGARRRALSLPLPLSRSPLSLSLSRPLPFACPAAKLEGEGPKCHIFQIA